MERSNIALDSSDFRDRLRQTPRQQVDYTQRSTSRPVYGMDGMVTRRPVVTAPVQAVPVPSPQPVLQPVLQSVRPMQSDVTPPTSRVVAPPQIVSPSQPTQPIMRLVKPVPMTQASRPRAQKSEVLWRSAVRRPIAQTTNAPERPRPERPKSRRPVLLYSMAGLVFIIGLAVSFNGMLANKHVSAQIKQISSSSSDGAVAGTGNDKKPTPPSTEKITTAAMSGYAVAPNLPRYIDITKLGVHARILSMGVTSSNRLQAPGNVYDAGWYNASAQPGQPGAMLLDGHISSWTTHGVFYGLNKLVAGDVISITRGDGQIFKYKVVKTQLFNADAVDMASLLVSQNSAKPGLNLISCSGDVIPDTNEFDKRFVVYTVME